ncbi:hypothetical protein E4634_01360 [Mangrovimicrobium sediminis]|uniref:DUF11 domain-containing protein n=1 Tax=Mangrovimicrobium sediminis TaxID=2562682 RepID=A0A4Z0M9L6_9GAMM|nr:DUF11 domain-containing protein [Haliea sp. SAOS-164]TGD76221.1 hypothetical protein E4634_01360 [Haliea sp. SAOS-164]
MRKSNLRPFNQLLLLAGLTLLGAGQALAEGSRELHPASYPAGGARSNLDIQPGQRYLDRVKRVGFLYVYAEAGEYIALGSSNRGNGDSSDGDILVYDPQDFGIPGDETLPGSADFSCTNGTTASGNHSAGSSLGYIPSRAAELAGANSADNSTTVTDGYAPCAYQAPVTGIYGVLFGAASSGGGPTGSVATTDRSSNTVAAWEVSVRAAAGSVSNIPGRLYSYAFIGFTGGNDRPVYSSLYYVTRDGYRYRQDLRGLDPNGYLLYANTFGFLDNGEPLYKTIRGNNAQVSNLPAGVTAPPAEYPIFFSDIAPGQPAASEAEKILQALSIPLVPPSPQIANVQFRGRSSGTTTTTIGVGGTFSFTTTDTVSYQIVISRDGVDFDPANPANRQLTGIAFSGSHEVTWNGLDNDQLPFPARPEPYAFRAYGRNGEVHFPIVDAENNGRGGVVGGGPTVVRLNGSSPGDTTAFFDDRGYVTSSGVPVGDLNGLLCGAATPAPASPAYNLVGVDSTTVYRRWQDGNNANSDCNSSAGWGDAKAVNLWTYFLTPPHSADLYIEGLPVDLSTSVTVTALAEPGDPVQGSVSFANYGINPASGVTYQLQLPAGLGSVSFSNLPAGVSASYDNGSGVVSFSGLPTTLASGEAYTGMVFTYTAPASGPLPVQSSIDTTLLDYEPINDTASAVTAIGTVDMQARVSGVAASVEPGSAVSGSVEFSNLGVDDAIDPTYTIQFGAGATIPAAVQFSNLPAGASVSYDANTGIATLLGMPATAPAAAYYSLDFSFEARAAEGETMTITAQVGTASTDANPANDTDAAETVLAYPPSRRIDVTANAVCVNDTPYLEYSITPVGFTPGNLATVEWLGSDDSTVQTLVDQPLDSGLLLWPGAAVDGSGEPTAWPGWEMVAGQWVEVPSLVRPTATVRFSVNPSAEVSVAYPPPTEACNANPPGTISAAPGFGGDDAQAIPTLPLPALISLLLALGGLGAARLGSQGRGARQQD